jgi:hypothetical protein
MSDFGLGDNIINETKLLKALKWHGFLLDRCPDSSYNNMERRAGKPAAPCIVTEISDGTVGDSASRP